MDPRQRTISGAALALLAVALLIAGSAPIDRGPAAQSAIASSGGAATATAVSVRTSATVTVTATVTRAPTRQPSPTATATPTRTPTPRPTATPRLTPTPNPTATAAPSSTPEPSPTPDPLALDAVAAVEAFDPADPASLARLDAVVARGGNVVPALERLLRDENPDRRYAALYVAVPLTRTAEDIAVLRVALDDPVPGFRVTAARALIGRGVVESIPALIEGLTLQQGLPYSDPPQPLAQFSRQALEFYTGQSFATPDEWRAWWEQARDRLVWTGAGYDVR